jgi:predicted Zn-dependent peptidase
MFEHMAFKGTTTVGTTDYEAEAKALAAAEDAYQAWQRERLAGRADAARLAALEAEYRAREEAANAFVVENEFGELLEREGGVGLNASTGPDVTSYFYSLPAHKLELFCFLESERFLHPVFRQFYRERDVVREERRMSLEGSPFGRLFEQFLGSAFLAHPYGFPTVGYMSDLESITATDAERFYRTYYPPGNLTTAIVGDVKAATVIPLLEKYFGRVPAGPAPPPLRTVEPPQIAEKTVTLTDPAQPLYLEGYHKPASTHPDEPIYVALSDVLSRGRTSRLYRALVRDRRLAVSVQSFSAFPGGKYPNLWVVFAVPARGVEPGAVQEAIRAELARLATEPVTEAELQRFKTRSRADLIRALGSNEGLAGELADYQRLTGDWRELFRFLDRLDAVTAADLKRVAGETFRPANRTVGVLVHGDRE